MTRKERKEAARIRCEERVKNYCSSVEKYVEQVKPSMNKALLHIQDCARNEIRKTPQMKEEIERCQGEAAKWFVENYSDKLVLDDKLSPEQVKNWRKTLCVMGLGSWALIMPEEDIEAIRKKFQRMFNELS
jgi:hypothetical protein